MEKVTYGGWANCYRLWNRWVELIVTTDVGPRVIRFGLVGGDNEFREFADMLGRTGGDESRIYGGHRLWHAPEANPRTYFPDNGPVKIEDHGRFVRLAQPVEPTTGIGKEIDLGLAADAAHVRVTHRLRNAGPWPVELAPSALSVMAPGGVGIVPLPPKGAHQGNLTPASSLVLWAYTDLADPRWTFGSNHVLLRQDAAASRPQKSGLLAPDGWAGFARGRNLFVKRCAVTSGADYPDRGCNVELFTNGDFLELETLGPLVTLDPGGEVEHVEQWFLFDGVASPANDGDVGRDILPKVRQTVT